MANVTMSVVRNLVAGRMGVLERARTVAANIGRRGGPRRADCCGNYGEPGC